MAPKRTRAESSDTVTPQVDAVITPNETVPQTDTKYDSIMQMVQELQEQNKVLSKKVAEASGDTSEQVKESKRRYGYNMDGSRRLDELFKYKFKTLIDDRQEKVVISSDTIGRPVHYMNSNTGKWTNQHDVEIVFQDGTKTEMDVLDYINQQVSVEHEVADSDIQVKDGTKYYTFRTEKFGTFTVSSKFIG